MAAGGGGEGMGPGIRQEGGKNPNGSEPGHFVFSGIRFRLEPQQALEFLSSLPRQGIQWVDEAFYLNSARGLGGANCSF